MRVHKTKPGRCLLLADICLHKGYYIHVTEYLHVWKIPVYTGDQHKLNRLHSDKELLHMPLSDNIQTMSCN